MYFFIPFMYKLQYSSCPLSRALLCFATSFECHQLSHQRFAAFSRCGWGHKLTKFCRDFLSQSIKWCGHGKRRIIARQLPSENFFEFFVTNHYVTLSPKLKSFVMAACHVCNKLFKSNGALSLHARQVHQSHELQCQGCLKTFLYHQYLRHAIENCSSNKRKAISLDRTESDGKNHLAFYELLVIAVFQKNR